MIGRSYHTRYITPEVFRSSLRTKTSVNGLQAHRKNCPGCNFHSSDCHTDCAATFGGIGAKRVCRLQMHNQQSIDTAFILRKSQNRSASTSPTRHQLSITNSITSCRRWLRWAPLFRLSTSIAMAGPTSMRRTAAKAARTLLYRNQQDGTFKDVAGEVGLADVNQMPTRCFDGCGVGRLRQRRLTKMCFSTSGASQNSSITKAERLSHASPTKRASRPGLTRTLLFGSTTIATASSICFSAVTTRMTSISGTSKHTHDAGEF